MLEHHDVERAIERLGPKRKRFQIGEAIEPGVVPSRIADRQIDADNMLRAEGVPVASFSRPGVEHSGAGGRVGRELGDGGVDRGLDSHQPTQQEAR